MFVRSRFALIATIILVLSAAIFLLVRSNELNHVDQVSASPEVQTPTIVPTPIPFRFAPDHEISAEVTATYIKGGKDFIGGVMENRQFEAWVLYGELFQVLRIESKEFGEEALELNVPVGEFLTGETYSATRYPFNEEGAGLNLHGFGRGCNQLSGDFEVTWVGQTTLRIEFTQHCENRDADYITGTWEVTFRPADLYDLPAATETPETTFKANV